jgi:hypothetical protein
MVIRKGIKQVRHGDYLADVEVEFREYAGKEWSPTLSLEDVRKLERVRKALQRGDMESAEAEATLYRLVPLHSGDPDTDAA